MGRKGSGTRHEYNPVATLVLSVLRVSCVGFTLSGLMRVAVVQQFYETRVIDEFVLRGNTATLKCLVPSFVADFVDVIEWLAVEDGSTYSANSQEEKGTSLVSITKSIFSESRR